MPSKYGEVPDNHFHLTPPQFSISISISIYINTNFRFSEDDPSHQDHHQEPEEDGGHPPSMEVPNNNFPLNTLIKFNEDKAKHHDQH